jgi:hypothetical protein
VTERTRSLLPSLPWLCASILTVSATVRAAMAHQFELLAKMDRFAASTKCRHAELAAYFGQRYTPPRRAMLSCSLPRTPPAAAGRCATA